jgi:hypothetical protein
MATQKKEGTSTTKKGIKVRDLKPAKDAKGGGGLHATGGGRSAQGGGRQAEGGTKSAF